MKFGIIGTGKIAAKFIANASLNPEFEAAAILSRSRERGEAFAAGCGIPKVYTAIDEMAADPSIEAVYIASPNSAHYEQSIQMSAAGKHVFCEKAVASNSQELIAMIDTAEKNDKIFLEAMRPAFNPDLARLKAIIADMGQPRNALISACQYSSRYDAFRSGEILNAFDPILSNGAVMDMGSYSIFMLVALFGEPQRIFCTDVKLHNGFDGFGAFIGVYPEMAAEVLYSKINWSKAGSEIMFEDGSITISDIPGVSGIEIHRRGKPSEKLTASGIPEYKEEAAMFIRCCQNPELAKPYHELSLSVMRIIDEVKRQNGITFKGEG
ncbi:MAG TPA: oxidoreductase [Clostridiales bacterium]|nr:oxidoreductase [Clostridiales bacterium]